MGQIHVLPDAVINQIAAGEVVERPASVVKELVENAVDAGATQITVTLKDGGRDLVSVLDNGGGMDEGDARLAVQRHATSKIRNAADLERIASLGFRGEALASIASVSRFELVTCTGGAEGGVCLTLADGEEPALSRQGFPQGTRVSCADLFYNTPARRKFLRSGPTEFQHVQGLLAQLALAHPQVHFRVQHNGKAVSSWPPAAALAERVLQIFGPEVHEGLAEVRGEEGPLAFHGLVSLPSHGRASRRWQHLFLNGRPVRNAGLNHAVYHAYRTLLMKDRHPAFFLKLNLHPAEADVNVHPAKSEVRLRNPQWAHTVLADRLHRALLEAGRRQALGEATVIFGPGRRGDPVRQVAESTAVSLAPAAAGPVPHAGAELWGRAEGLGQGWAGATLAAEGAERAGGEAAPFHFHALGGATGLTPGGAAEAARGSAARHAGGALGPGPGHGAPWLQGRGLAPQGDRPGAGGVASGGMASGGIASGGIATGGGIGLHSQGMAPDGGAVVPGGQAPLAMPLGVQVLSQLHTTYILAQRDGGLVVIDQHAAHERILFEQLRAQFLGGAIRTERFLVPPTFELSPQNSVLLEQYLPQWQRLGFAIEGFGRLGYLVREAPALLAGRDLKALILEVLDELALFGKSGRLEEVVNEILERVACHGAIRAGRALSGPEMEALVAQLEQLEINLYCPHGRPVWVEIGERELEKRFKRIV